MEFARFETLLERHADGVASPAELEELAALLKANPGYRRELVERTRVEVALHEVLAAQATANRPSVRMHTTRPRARRRAQRQTSWMVQLAFVACVFLVFGAYYWQSQVSPALPLLLANVGAVSGAHVVRFSGTVALKNGDPIHNNETVFTPAGGSAALRYPDGTQVTLGAESRATLSAGPSGKQVLLLSGEVTAAVAKQHSGQAMVFETAGARATVLGTQLKLVNAGGAARLEVTEGRVRLQRLSDGQAVDVRAGQVAVAAPGKSLVAEALDAPVAARQKLPALGAPLLIEDFENGKMEGWINGIVAAEGADDSRYALAAQGKDGTLSVIFSAVRLPTTRLPLGTRTNEWIFKYQPGLVLQFAYFLEKDSGAIRVQGFNNEQDDNFNTLIEAPVSGRWTTVQVRLDDFKHNDPQRRNESLRPGTHFRSLQFMVGSDSARLLIDSVLLAPPASSQTR